MKNIFALGSALWRWRMHRILKRNLIPHHIWQSVTKSMLVLSGLDAVQMAQLREMAAWFLDQKSITGAQGLNVTLAMRVTIAAQACLLILKLGVEYFDGWVEVILYRGAFRVNHTQMDSIGVIHNEANVLTGESWLRGPVILSWDDVERDAYNCKAGHNVVLHEFAHKLDSLNGAMNGMPPLHHGMSQKRWSDVFCKAYNKLCLQIETGESIYINEYAATSPAEFYAVLSEYFFTAPDILNKYFPDVYEQLTLFYQQPVSH